MGNNRMETSKFFSLISKSGDIDKIYEALNDDDPSNVVIAAMGVMKNTLDLDFTAETKSEDISNKFLKEANQYHSAERFRKALECYNKSLLYAPEYSDAMKLAYSNRSALLFTVNAYSACIKDIDTCFSMGCNDYKLRHSLKQLKSECLQNVRQENFVKNLSFGSFSKQFFKLNVKCHPQIPCASTDVDVIVDSGLPKTVAAKLIPVGKLVALEMPFVSELDEDNYYISCHYCHTLSLNLIPCDDCCSALFCNEDCLTKCKKEYHSIECKVMVSHKHNDFGSHSNGYKSVLKLRAAIKIKQMCKSWKEFIDASYNIGENRMRTSSISDIYDVTSKFSLLSHDNPSHFIFGERFNQSFVCAMEILALEKLPTFFPKKADEREAAIQAFARIMMHLYSSYRSTEFFNAAMDIDGNVTTNTEHNFGWYSFAGKLSHSCDANLLLLGVKNKVALIAIRPIKKGDELMVSYIGHYYENIPANRQRAVFRMTNQICECQVCIKRWSSRNLKKLKNLPKQKKAYNDWTELVQSLILINWDETVYKATCLGLAALQGAQSTTGHHEMFKQFRMLTAGCQYAASNNQFIQKDDEEFELVFHK